MRMWLSGLGTGRNRRVLERHHGTAAPDGPWVSGAPTATRGFTNTSGGEHRRDQGCHRSRRCRVAVWMELLPRNAQASRQRTPNPSFLRCGKGACIRVHAYGTAGSAELLLGAGQLRGHEQRVHGTAGIGSYHPCAPPVPGWESARWRPLAGAYDINPA